MTYASLEREYRLPESQWIAGAGAPRFAADAAFRLTLLAVYIALIFHAGTDHVLWRDEAQAWLIGRDAKTLGGVFQNLSYDGHPALWHTLLFILSRFSDDPNLMLALNFVVMATTAALVLWFMPLRAWERVLFPFGYFMLFEYGVKARSYGLGGLLLILICLAWPTRARRPLLIALLLFLLANTHVLFTIVTIAIVTSLVVESVLRWPGSVRLSASALFALLMVVAGWLLATWTFVPPADSGFATAWHFILSAPRLEVALAALPAVFGAPEAVPQWLAVALMLATLWSVRRAPTAAIWLFLSVIGIVAFGYIKYAAYIWHHGVIFLTWFSAIWVARLEETRSIGRRDGVILSACLTTVLASQAYYGITTYRMELERPYSNSRAAASFIATLSATNPVIAALNDATASGVIAYLGAQRVYFVNGRRLGTFTIWDQARRDSNVEAALGDLDRKKRPIALIVSVTNDSPSLFVRHGYREMARFTGATWSDEDFVIYLRPSRR